MGHNLPWGSLLCTLGPPISIAERHDLNKCQLMPAMFRKAFYMDGFYCDSSKRREAGEKVWPLSD
jgi:hypothetical protein